MRGIQTEATFDLLAQVRILLPSLPGFRAAGDLYTMDSSFFFFLFGLFRAAPTAHGSSQARG